MSTKPTTRSLDATVPNTRLLLQVAATAAAWLSLGLGDILITWQACVHEEQFGGPSVHPLARALYFAVAGLVFAVAVLAGTMSYRSWHRLSAATSLLAAEGREPREFMSLAGVFISVTLGAGILWLCLPLFLLEMCMRTR